MNNATLESDRFVAFDVSKRNVVVAAVDSQQKLILQPRKIPLEKFEGWCLQNLKSTDLVVLEATCNAWQFHDQLKPLVREVVVANAFQVKLIAQAKVKTDARDAINLARLLAASLIPAVWVPPTEVRELRALVAHRCRLIRQRTQVRNRLHAKLQTYNLVAPAEPFSPKSREWWENLTLPPSQKLLMRQELTNLANVQPLIEEVESELRRLSNSPEWVEPTTRLLQLPGIGLITAMIILSAIGQISRFESPKHLVGYSGLGTSVFATGQTLRTGSITKQGRSELRTALVEAAWSAVEYDDHWKSRFEKLAARIGRNKAIIAIARKLLVVIWHLLSKKVANREANAAQIARRLWRWGSQLKRAGRNELSLGQFVRLKLEKLEIGAELEEVRWGKTSCSLPPPSQIAS